MADFYMVQDRAFLTSDSYRDMMQRLVFGLTNRRDLRVHLLCDGSEESELAFTDNQTVNINPLHPMFKNMTITDVSICCMALILHECLHPLYTDFHLVQRSALRGPLSKQIFNILEDSRIERIGASVFPGIAYGLDFLNLTIYRRSLPKYQKQQEEDDDPKAKAFDALMDNLFCYAVVGRPGPNLPDIEEVKADWHQIVKEVDVGRLSDVCRTCFAASENIVKILEKYCDDQDNVPAFIKGVSFADFGDGQSQPAPQIPQNAPDFQGKRREQYRFSLGEGEDDSSGNSLAFMAAGANGNTSGQSVQENGNDEGEPGSGRNDGFGDAPSNGAGGERNPLSQMIESAVEQAMANFQREKADQKADQKTASAYNDETAKLHLVRLQPKENLFTKYEERRKEGLSTIKKTVRKMKEILNYNQDELVRYQPRGNVDGQSLSRILNGNVCAKRIEKSDESDLRVTILVDCSGSMIGDRMKNAVLSAVVLQEVCLDMKIPCDTLGFEGKNLLVCNDGNFRNKWAKHSVVSLTPGGGTPLAEALAMVRTRLSKAKEEDKLLFVITDGVPNSDSNATSEIAKLRKQGVFVYGFSIGSDATAVSALFAPDSICITNLKELPQKMCAVVKRKLLK